MLFIFFRVIGVYFLVFLLMFLPLFMAVPTIQALWPHFPLCFLPYSAVKNQAFGPIQLGCFGFAYDAIAGWGFMSGLFFFLAYGIFFYAKSWIRLGLWRRWAGFCVLDFMYTIALYIANGLDYSFWPFLLQCLITCLVYPCIDAILQWILRD